MTMMEMSQLVALAGYFTNQNLVIVFVMKITSCNLLEISLATFQTNVIMEITCAATYALLLSEVVLVEMLH